MAHQSCAADNPHNTEADLFRARLENMIDMTHPLVRVAQIMPWDDLITAIGHTLPSIPAGAGRRPLPARLVIGLLYLKHAYNLSDEAVCQRWLENPYFQYFCGEVVFQTRLPCDNSSLTRYRKRLGEEGVEELLAQTIAAAQNLKAINRSDLKRVVIDSTVQEKDVAHPTDSRLLETARAKLVDAASREHIDLRQSYQRVGPRLARRAGRYAHARQYKRMRRVIARQRTLVGRLIRDIQRKASSEALERLQPTLERADQLRQQERKSKHKIYAWHAPEVECISKGKARNPYEFGVKVSNAISAKKAFILGARSYPGNPYDGDTLCDQHEQVGILTGVSPTHVLVDLGYRGRKVAGARVMHRGMPKHLSPEDWQWLKRRASVEPVIGHLKADHRLRRCFLKGALGDAQNAVLAAAGYNLRWLMRWLRLFCAWILSMSGGLKASGRVDESPRPHERAQWCGVVEAAAR
ncbi:MAG TPA: IS5 family transposase [Rhodanobacteraceae bacterium]